MELSGQALEHCNQLRKQDGKLTSKCMLRATQVTKEGKRKRGMMDQLMGLEVVRNFFAQHMGYKQRPSLWYRQVQVKGRKGTGLVKKEPQGIEALVQFEEE